MCGGGGVRDLSCCLPPLASQTLISPHHLQVLRELLPEGHEGALDQDYDTE